MKFLVFSFFLQVIFVPEKAPPAAYSSKVELWGTTHDLYSYSFDNVGLVSILSPLIKSLQKRNIKFFNLDLQEGQLSFMVIVFLTFSYAGDGVKELAGSSTCQSSCRRYSIIYNEALSDVLLLNVKLTYVSQTNSIIRVT